MFDSRRDQHGIDTSCQEYIDMIERQQDQEPSYIIYWTMKEDKPVEIGAAHESGRDDQAVEEGRALIARRDPVYFIIPSYKPHSQERNKRAQNNKRYHILSAFVCLLQRYTKRMKRPTKRSAFFTESASDKKQFPNENKYVVLLSNAV